MTLQPTFMHRVLIPNAPSFANGLWSNNFNLGFTILERSTKIPEFERSYKKVRFLNNATMIPLGTDSDNLWTVTVALDAEMKQYEIIKQWFLTLSNPLTAQIIDPNVNAWIETINLNGNKRTSLTKLVGVAPKKIPQIDLDQESTDGFVTVEVEFVYDHIDYDVLSIPINIPEFTPTI